MERIRRAEDGEWGGLILDLLNKVRAVKYEDPGDGAGLISPQRLYELVCIKSQGHCLASAAKLLKGGLQPVSSEGV